MFESVVGGFTPGSARRSNKPHKEITDEYGENEEEEEHATRNRKAKCENEWRRRDLRVKISTV